MSPDPASDIKYGQIPRSRSPQLIRLIPSPGAHWVHNPVCTPGTQARARQAPLQGADGGTGLRMLLHLDVHLTHSSINCMNLRCNLVSMLSDLIGLK